MKTLLKVGFVVIIVLFSLTTCNLTKDISVQWTVYAPTEFPIGSSFAIVTYDVWNAGKYDLSGVKLDFRLSVAAGDFYFTTPKFSLSEGQTLYGNTVTVDIVPPNHVVAGDFAEVIGVDMDKPKD